MTDTTKTQKPSEKFQAYMQASLDATLASIKGSYKTRTVEDLQNQVIGLQDGLIRELTAERPSNVSFWNEVGIPAEISAVKDEIQLRKFYEAAISPDFARATSGHPVAPNFLNIYHTDHGPTHVRQVASLNLNCPYFASEGKAILAGRSVYLGGQAGR